MTDAQVLVVLARRVRRFLGRRLTGVAALADTGIPVILGFARSGPIRARRATLSPQQRRWLRAGGATRLGTCPWDSQPRLFALGTRTPGDKRGPWVYGTSLRSVGPRRLAPL